MSILTLEVYYRYLPLYRTADDDQEKMDTTLKGDDGPDEQKADPPAGKKADAKKNDQPAQRKAAGKDQKASPKQAAEGGLE